MYMSSADSESLKGRVGVKGFRVSGKSWCDGATKRDLDVTRSPALRFTSSQLQPDYEHTNTHISTSDYCGLYYHSN